LTPPLCHLPSSGAEVCLALFVYASVSVSPRHTVRSWRAGGQHGKAGQERGSEGRPCRAPARELRADPGVPSEARAGSAAGPRPAPSAQHPPGAPERAEAAGRAPGRSPPKGWGLRGGPAATSFLRSFSLRVRGGGDQPLQAHPGPETLRPPPLLWGAEPLQSTAAGGWEGGGASELGGSRRPLPPPRALLGGRKSTLEKPPIPPRPLGLLTLPGPQPPGHPPYLAGFVELLLQPGHRHRDCAGPERGGLEAPPGHAAVTGLGSGRPGRSPRDWAPAARLPRPRPPPRPPPLSHSHTHAHADGNTAFQSSRAAHWPSRGGMQMRPLGAAHASLLRGDLEALGRGAGTGCRDVLRAREAEPPRASRWWPDEMDASGF
jgi:hypothetical protein